MTPADRPCVSCGRGIAWRKKRERDWEQVRYCSHACRRRGIRPIDRRLEELIAARLNRGGEMADVADAAREVSAADGVPETELTEPARRAARRLVAAGQAEIVQDGRVVDPRPPAGDSASVGVGEPFGIPRSGGAHPPARPDPPRWRRRGPLTPCGTNERAARRDIPARTALSTVPHSNQIWS